MSQAVPRLRVTLHQKPPIKLGEPVKGEIHLIPIEDSHVNSLGYKLELQSRGRLQTGTILLLQENLVSDKAVIKNKKYVFPFEFINYSYPSYKSPRVEAVLRLRAFVQFNSPKDKKLSLKWTRSKSDKTWEYDYYIDFTPIRQKFRIKTNDITTLKPKSLYKLSFSIFFFSIVLFFISTIEDIRGAQTIIIALGSTAFIISLLSIIFVHFRIDELKVSYLNLDDNRFKVGIANNKKWKGVNKLSISYRIMEETIDNLGSMKSKVLTRLYTSESQTIENPKNDISAIFEFPDMERASLAVGDFRIFWVLEMTLTTTIGFKFKFEEEFVTKYKLPEPQSGANDQRIPII